MIINNKNIDYLGNNMKIETFEEAIKEGKK